jgi:hypothetical protein
LGCALIAGDPGRAGLVLPSPKSRGSHRAEGLLLLSGPRVSPSTERGTAEIADVAPMALRLLGLSPPAGMDGRVPEGAFASLPEARSPSPRDGGTDGSRDRAYTEDEESEVRQRLRNLGYID